MIGPERLVRSAEQASLAFRDGANGITAELRTQRAVMRGAAIEITPFTFPGGQRTPHAPVTIETAAITTGTGELPSASAPRVAGGAVELQRGVVVEQLTNDVDGLHQEWRVPAPLGEGSLAVGIAVRGATFAGTTSSGVHFTGDGVGLRYSHAVWSDATGREWAIPVEYDPATAQLRIVVAAKVMAATHFPALLDPVISAEAAVDAPVVAPTDALQQHVSLAYGGGEYLAVWEDSRDSAYADIWATRLASDGTILDPLGIRIAGDPGNQSNPAVAFDGTQFIVAWEDFKTTSGTEADIIAAHVSTTGTVTRLGAVAATGTDERYPQVSGHGDGTALVIWNAAGTVNGSIAAAGLGTAFPIASGAQVDFPAVAANPAGDYLVAWSASSRVLAQLVSASGTLDGAAIAVSAATGTQTQPAATFDGTTFDLVWLVQARFVYGSRLSTAGAVLDKRPSGTTTVGGVAISSTTSQAARPAIACQASGCFALWHDQRNFSTTSWDLYAQLLTSTFTRSGSEVAFSTALGPQQKPSLASSGSGFFSAWTDGRSLLTTYQIFGATVSSSGAIGTAAAIGTGNNRESFPALGRDGTTVGLFWRDSRSTVPNIYYSRYDGAGTALDTSAQAACPGSAAQVVPAASDDLGGSSLLVWSDARNGVDKDVYASRIDLGGTGALDSGGIAIATATGDQLVPQVASNGSVALVVWEDRRSGTFDIYGALVDASGAVLARDIVISNATSNQDAPDVVWDAASSQFIVVWQDYRSGTQFDVYGTRVAADGTVLDAAGVLIASAANQSGVAIASGASGSFAAWQRGSAIVGTRLTGGASLSVVDASGIAISSGSSHQTSARVSSLGAAFLVVWTDDRAGNFDLYAQLVGSDGITLGTEIPVATSSDDEQASALLPTSAGARLAYEVHRSDSSQVATRLIGNAGESITVTPASPSIAKGLTQAFTAVLTYSDGTTQDVTSTATWTSATTTVATMSGNVATGAGVGTSTITATVGAVTGSTTLTVTGPTMVSIAVTPAGPSIAKGLTQAFTATATYTDATTQDVSGSVTWASSDATVATMSSNVATGVGVGTSTISAALGTVSGSTTLTVTPAVLVSIDVEPALPSIAAGTSQAFSAIGTYTDASTVDLTSSVTWASSTPATATITSGGIATGVAVGTTTISATSGTITGSTTLTVTAATLSSLDVEPVDPTIAKGTTQAFTATGVFSDGSTQDMTTQVAWTSSSTTVATITSGGLASGIAVGTSTITATKGSVSNTSLLTVTSAALVSIALSPTSPSIAKGTTVQLTATGTFSDGTTQDISAQVAWSSSTTSTATVSATGLVTGAAAGTSTISASLAGKTASTVVTVTNAALVSIAVTPATKTVAKGWSLQYTATGTFSDGTTQNITTNVTWSSSTTTVATISNATGTKGWATVAAAGTTTISATLGGKTGTATLTGTNATLTTIRIAPQTFSLAVRATRQLTATGSFSDGTTLDITGQVAWKSANKKVASVSQTGLATGKKAGTVTLSAKKGQVTGFATVTVM